MREGGLHTICEEARCPNIGECWGRGTATFQILGDTCTRACRYCYVHSGKPDGPPDPLEPLRLAQAAAQMGLSHVVVTSVDRDDLPDRGAAHYAATIRAIQRKLPDGEGRDPHARLPRRRGGGARDRARRATRRLRPQHRDGPPAPRAHARREGELRQGALAARAREGGRRLPRADEVRDHRRARGDERRGRRDDARPARARRRRRHDRPVPAAVAEARARSTAGCTPTSSAGSASRARRSASARCSPARSSARRTARTSSATRPRPAAARSRTETRRAARRRPSSRSGSAFAHGVKAWIMTSWLADVTPGFPRKSVHAPYASPVDADRHLRVVADERAVRELDVRVRALASTDASALPKRPVDVPTFAA